MILETNQVTSSIYESIGNYVVAAVIAAIGYFAKTKYDKHVKEQEKLETKKAEYNEQIIKAVTDLTKTQQKLESTISKIVEEFEVVKKDYAQTQKDNEETRHLILDYFGHADRLTTDYNHIKAAVLDIQDVLKSKKYDIRVSLDRNPIPTLRDTHLGFHGYNTDVA